MNQPDQETVDIYYDELCIFRSTPSAYCITFGQTRAERRENIAFIAKSISDIDDENNVITMPVWLATQKGLI